MKATQSRNKKVYLFPQLAFDFFPIGKVEKKGRYTVSFIATWSPAKPTILSGLFELILRVWFQSAQLQSVSQVAIIQNQI